MNAIEMKKNKIMSESSNTLKKIINLFGNAVQIDSTSRRRDTFVW